MIFHKCFSLNNSSYSIIHCTISIFHFQYSLSKFHYPYSFNQNVLINFPLHIFTSVPSRNECFKGYKANFCTRCLKLSLFDRFSRCGQLTVASEPINTLQVLLLYTYIGWPTVCHQTYRLRGSKISKTQSTSF